MIDRIIKFGKRVQLALYINILHPNDTTSYPPSGHINYQIRKMNDNTAQTGDFQKAVQGQYRETPAGLIQINFTIIFIIIYSWESDHLFWANATFQAAFFADRWCILPLAPWRRTRFLRPIPLPSPTNPLSSMWTWCHEWYLFGTRMSATILPAGMWIFLLFLFRN